MFFLTKEINLYLKIAKKIILFKYKIRNVNIYLENNIIK